MFYKATNYFIFVNNNVPPYVVNEVFQTDNVEKWVLKE